MAAVSSDVSLFSGGLLPRLLRLMGVEGAGLERLRTAEVLVVPLIAWLPLLALCAMNGTLIKGNASSPFLADLGLHIRLLVVLPLLFIAARVAEQRIAPTLEQFQSRLLIPAESAGRFEATIASALRLGDSILADVLIIAAIFAADSVIAWQTYTGVNTSTWYATPSPSGSMPTPAGIWYLYISLPIFQFVMLRWYYRLFIWARFLVQVAGLDLRLLPAHPDRFGGLGFLLSATQALAIFAAAHGALLAGWLANRVLIGGASLTNFKGETIVLVVFVLCITIAPLFAFTRVLARSKRRATLQYGTLAAQYLNAFESKWLRSKPEHGEELVGSADIQSLADMGGSYELIRNMRILMPVSADLIVVFIVAVLLPVSPLILTVMPLNELLRKLAGVLF